MLTESFSYKIALQLFSKIELPACSLSSNECEQLKCIWHFLRSFESATLALFWSILSNNTLCSLFFNQD